MPVPIQKSQLAQFNQHDFSSLPKEQLVILCEDSRLSINLLYERLGMNSHNSSLSPSTMLPWQQVAANDPECIEEEVKPEYAPASKHQNKADIRKRRKTGYGRKQVLTTNETIHLNASCCSSCDHIFKEKEHRCYQGFYQIDLKRRTDDDSEYDVFQTKFRLYDSICPVCDTVTHTHLARIKTDIEGKTISSRGLIGPALANVLIHLHKENGTSFRKTKKSISFLYGISLSTGAITAAVNEGGVCCEPQVESYRREAENTDYAHMDETGWKDGGESLWLWVIVTTNICLFMMGRRTKEMALTFLNSNFKGWLMSDGYRAYRGYQKRFRCWAHLLRKAKGLSESQLTDVTIFGYNLLAHLKSCMDGIYTARKNGITSSIKGDFEETLTATEALCKANQDSNHPKVRSLAREFLHDFDAIFRILDYPEYPLTNNEAERALRHWVILRKVIQGTQSEIGRRATCAIASMIATGNRKKENCMLNIEQCIDNLRGVLNNISHQPLRLSG